MFWQCFCHGLGASSDRKEESVTMKSKNKEESYEATMMLGTSGHKGDRIILASLLVPASINQNSKMNEAKRCTSRQGA